jgi:hypothetical protein
MGLAAAQKNGNMAGFQLIGATWEGLTGDMHVSAGV